MTLIKSLLLGSAAGIVAVATAQAADLPTRKAAPVEYVRVCNVGGITGWTLPGSDTCVKFSGYMTAHFIGGNLNRQFNSASPILTAKGLGPVSALYPFPSTAASRCRTRGTLFSIAMRSAGTSAPISALIWLRTPLTAR
jgi:Porin subfamily